MDKGAQMTVKNDKFVGACLPSRARSNCSSSMARALLAGIVGVSMGLLMGEVFLEEIREGQAECTCAKPYAEKFMLLPEPGEAW